MDERRQRLIEDLAGLLKGEIRCDALTVAQYASDASLYQVPPLGVVYPRDRDDVVAVARYAAEQHVPLVPRGAGSGVAGGAVGSGLVVDFSRFMRRIETVGDETIRVQPGIVRDRLNHVLRPYGRYFPPDPANSGVTTVGGMLAVDAAGSHSVRVGSTRDHVESLEIVLAGGRCLEAGTEPLDLLRTPPPGPQPTVIGSGSGSDDPNLKRTIVSKLAKLLADHQDLILEKQPALLRNCCGYNLRGVLGDGLVSLPRLLVGSEGTLGLFTAATLHTAPLPPHRGVVLLLFGQLELALRGVQLLAPQQPAACDLLDRRLLSLARESDPRFEQLIAPAAEAALIVEQTGFSDRQVRDRIRQVIDAVRLADRAAVVAHEAYDFDEVEFLWSLPSKVVPLLNRLKGQTRPLPFVEDVAVPPESLHEFLVKAQRVFQKHQVTASLYAHAAAGQLHLRPFLPAPRPEDGPLIEAIARDLYQVVFSMGGSISGEHGDGLARTAFIRSQYGPLYRVFQQIKDLFDPHNLLNPGKIISDDPHVTVRNFRPPVAPAPSTVELQLRWTATEMAQAAGRCNGCGTCRSQSADLRMCPFFRIDHSEEASPRAKANVVRSLASGGIGADDLASPDMQRLARLCFNCKQCQLECPSGANVPQMMIEAKAAHVATHGLGRADWLLTRGHTLTAAGSAASLATNWIITNPAARWLLEKTAGVARQRKLPLFARRAFLRSAGRQLRRLPPPNGPHKPVVYFVGDYANYFDPELARALVAVLHHNGIPVHVPAGQTSSGMALITAGDLESARETALRNLRALGELAREGYTIICTEPSAALALRQEYPMLLDHPDVEAVAARTVEAGQFLEQLHRDSRLRTDFTPLPLEAGYHTPCHLKALAGGSPLVRLLSLIPELRVHTIEKGCSGMAATFGLTRENFRTSVRIGWGLIARMREGDLAVGLTECSSCKMQMEQGTATPTLHPIKLLALAYGLMPELRQKLRPSPRKLVVT